MDDTPVLSAFEKDKLKYPMMEGCTFDPRLLGTKAILCPTPQFNSSQRMAMLSSNIVQALIPYGAEVPAVASGFENKFLDYTFNSARMPQSGKTVACIPKYVIHAGRAPIRFNPSYVLVFIGDKDGKVHYIEVQRYTKCTDGFGYPNKVNETLLRRDIHIPEGTLIGHSPAVQGEKYCLGLNANVAYMSMKETVEDAFVMSKSLAERMGSTAIKTLVVNIDKNMVPLNLYGSSDDYKIIPDLHENVRADGVICGFRTVNDASMIADMTDESLMNLQYHHDDIYFAAAPNATIIDIDIYRNPNRSVKTPSHVFGQIDKYIENSLTFHRSIIDVYEKECLKEHREPSPAFVVLVERAKQILAANREKIRGIKSVPKFTYKSEPIRYIQLVITYMYENKVTKGSKSTGREGAGQL